MWLIRTINQRKLATSHALILSLMMAVTFTSATIEQPSTLENVKRQVSGRDKVASVAGGNTIKCSPHSMMLARQAIIRELEQINPFNSLLFNDLDKNEMIDGQKQSLGNIVSSGSSDQLMTSDGRPLFEIEASYFRPLNINHWPSSIKEHNKTIVSMLHSSSPPTANGNQPIVMKLIRKFQDHCHLDKQKEQFNYVFGLAVGPIEHNLDVIVNLNRDLSLTQPIDWHYAQVRLIVPRMNFEISLRQVASTKLINSVLPSSGCPLEVEEVNYLGGGSQLPKPPQLAISALGLAATNQTMLQLERLFNDYTRPAVSTRLRQVLKFHLNSKTLPLQDPMEVL